MPRRSKTELELGFCRSFWEEVVEIQNEYAGAVGLYAYATPKVGVFKYRLVFTPLLEREANAVGSHTYQFEYPNASAQTMASAFWTAAMQLHDMIVDAAWGLETRPEKES